MLVAQSERHQTVVLERQIFAGRKRRIDV